MIAKKIEVEGSGKGKDGWFELDQVSVSYDHPFHVEMEHALNIDFVNDDLGPGARVAVELSEEAARNLVSAIQDVLSKADKDGFLESSIPAGD